MVRNGLGGCGGATLSFECANMTRRLCDIFHEYDPHTTHIAMWYVNHKIQTDVHGSVLKYHTYTTIRLGDICKKHRFFRL